jgi:cell division protein FtsL
VIFQYMEITTFLLLASTILLLLILILLLSKLEAVRNDIHQLHETIINAEKRKARKDGYL